VGTRVVSRHGGAVPPSQVAGTPRLLPFGWAFLAMFALYPLWWLLGLGAFIWPLLSIPLAAYLGLSLRLTAPRGFVVWLFFLAWVAVSAGRLTTTGDALTYTFRAGSYVSATVIFLYVLSTSEEQLPTRRIVDALALMWAFVVIGGLIGMALPHVSFSSPVERMLPGSLLGNRWLRDLVHPAFAQNFGERGFEVNGARVTRTMAPFAYTNWWGANYVVLVPFALVAYRMLRSRLLRGILGILILASILPFIQSANRGAWLSLAIGLVYAVVRFTGQGSLGAVLRLLVLVVAASLLVIASPLGSVVRDRLAEPGSESLRISLYEQATQAAAGSPIFGYGVPLPPPDSPYVLPNVGTQGQLWLVLVSAGLPAAVAFLAWMSYVAVASRRRRDAIGVAAHLAIVMAILQVPVYGMVPIELQVFMVAAALVWRPPREEAAGPGVAYLWTEPRVRAA